VEYTDHDPHVPLTLTTGWEVPFTPHGVPELSKDMAERLQLELYVHDWWEGLGSPPLLMVSKGEKPDFRVRTPSGEMGLDATRLTSEDRRRAHNLHGYIRAAIRNAPEDFRHLHGWLVTVWFAANQIPGAELPPARPTLEHEIWFCNTWRASTQTTLPAIPNRWRVSRAAVRTSSVWGNGNPGQISTGRAAWNLLWRTPPSTVSPKCGPKLRDWRGITTTAA